MRDFIEIGSAPCEEDCVSVSRDVDYLPAMRAECVRFIELIRKTLGPEPEGAHLAVKSNPHDFGTYLEAVCYFDDSNEEARHYAFKCESDAPATWDAQPKPPSGPAGEVLQCADCNLVTIARDTSARDVFCNCCGRKLWRLTAHDPETSSPYSPPPDSERVGDVVRKTKTDGVCDACLEAAAEHGIHDRFSQDWVMVELGADLPDHLCDGVEAPDVVTNCACACRRR